MSVWTLYLLRHGETEWNRAGRIQGRLDSPLTERGRAQARAMGAALNAEIGDAEGWRVVASPRGRALETARLVCGALDLPTTAIEIDDRLAEMSCGDWEGLTWTEIEARHPGALDGARPWEHFFRAPNAESWDSLTARVAAWLAEATARPRTVAVAHGMVHVALRAVHLGLGKDQALDLDRPQDAFYRLSQGGCTRVACLAAA